MKPCGRLAPFERGAPPQQARQPNRADRIGAVTGARLGKLPTGVVAGQPAGKRRPVSQTPRTLQAPHCGERAVQT